MSLLADRMVCAIAPVSETETPWIPHKPEQRFSVVLRRFLRRALKQPCWFTAIHDADGGTRTDRQRIRDKERGIESGQLDWEVHQGPPYLTRKVELKRGTNKTTDNQDSTIAKLTVCGAKPIVAWTLREAYEGMVEAGFRFEANVATTLQHCEALLDAWDREAEAIKAGTIIKKRRAPQKSGPRFLAGKRFTARARKSGVMF